MKKNSSYILNNKDFATVFFVTAAILLVPLVAMQFSDDWNWDLSDFVTIGILLVSTGLLIALASRKINNINYRAAAIIALVVSLLLIWTELAVGLFGSPLAGS